MQVGDNFDERHTGSCQKGGFISFWHEDIRYITNSLLKEVCSDVTTEPLLQPLKGEEFHYKTAKVEQKARVGINARGFWNNRDKTRKYSERIKHVEQGIFISPVVIGAK